MFANLVAITNSTLIKESVAVRPLNVDVVWLYRYSFPIDLDGPMLCQGSAIEGGMEMDGPWITLPDTPGLGVSAVRGLRDVQHY